MSKSDENNLGLVAPSKGECYRCRRAISLDDKHEIVLPKYIEIQCGVCKFRTRLPIFNTNVKIAKDI